MICALWHLCVWPWQFFLIRYPTRSPNWPIWVTITTTNDIRWKSRINQFIKNGKGSGSVFKFPCGVNSLTYWTITDNHASKILSTCMCYHGTTISSPASRKRSWDDYRFDVLKTSRFRLVPPAMFVFQMKASSVI